MREIVIKPGEAVPLGFRGENDATQILFDVTGWAEEFGEGVFQLLARLPGDEDAYTVPISYDGDYVRWTVTSGDTAITGSGAAQLEYYVGTALAKSCSFLTVVAESLGPSSGIISDAEAWAIGEREGEPVPESDETYHNNSKYYAGEAEASSEAAAASAVAAQETVEGAQTAIDAAKAAAVQDVQAEGTTQIQAVQAAGSQAAQAAADSAAEALRWAQQSATNAQQARANAEITNTMLGLTKQAAADAEVSASDAEGSATDAAGSATAAAESAAAAQTAAERDVPEAAAAWLAEHVDPETGYVIDDSLSIQGAAADAKATGNRLTVVEGLLGGKEPLRNMGIINETYDLNNIQTIGLYRWTASHMPANCPSNYSCMMMVLQGAGSGNYIQVLYPALPTAMPYIRTHRSGAWTNWYRFASTDVLDTAIANVNTQIGQIEQVVNNLYFPIIDQIIALEDGDGYITDSFDITYTLQAEPKILCIAAQYTGDMPTIQIIPYNPDTGSVINASPAYELGGAREPTRRSWRIPMATGSVKQCTIRVQIPTGTKLSVRSAEIKDDQRQRYVDTGIKYHGHAGCFAPANTIEAFQIGAELGFNSMITVPKFTADGVGVCFHDDGSISGDLCWMDGTAISGTDNVGIENYTYAELTEKFRLKPVSWGFLHVPTLDEYFRICSLTGMAPILSVHSAGFGMNWADGFAAIKGLAKKWNVLNKLGIKSGTTQVQSAARQVFGTEIGCYIFLSGQTHAPYDILSLAKTSGFVDASATDLTGCEYNLVSEYFYAQTVDTGTYYSQTMASMAQELGRGFKLSVATTGSGISGPEMVRLIDLGVTEFTVDHHISLGLNW